MMKVLLVLTALVCSVTSAKLTPEQQLYDITSVFKERANEKYVVDKRFPKRLLETFREVLPGSESAFSTVPDSVLALFAQMNPSTMELLCNLIKIQLGGGRPLCYKSIICMFGDIVNRVPNGQNLLRHAFYFIPEEHRYLLDEILEAIEENIPCGSIKCKKPPNRDEL